LGVNKDSLTCSLPAAVVSPHHDFFPAAAGAAKSATIKYLLGVRDALVAKKGNAEGEQLFKRFLGIGVSIGFAIDTTGSMSEEINGVQGAVKGIVESRIGTSDEPSSYTLAQIHDPSSTLSLVTTNSSAFLSAISGLGAGGGGDCPELAGLGTYMAASAMPTGGDLYVFTDATAKDPDKMGEAKSFAMSKKIAVHHALSGSCSPYDPKYFELSEATGGQVFIINKNEAGALTEALLATALSPSRVDIARVSDQADGAKSYEFIVDSTSDKLFVTISVTSGAVSSVSVIRPDGREVKAGETGVSISALSRSFFYNIALPQQGIWKVSLEGSGEFNVNAAANSPLSFEYFDFVEYDDSAHPGYFRIDGYPLAGSKSAVKAVLHGEATDVRFELRAKSGETIRAFTLDSFGEYPEMKAFLTDRFYYAQR
jgi:hypothetical protein